MVTKSKSKTTTPTVVLNVNVISVTDPFYIARVKLNGLLPDDYPEQESYILQNIRLVGEQPVLQWDYVPVSCDELKMRSIGRKMERLLDRME